MNKILPLLLICTFVYAEKLVYDYRSSFTRAEINVVNDNGDCKTSLKSTKDSLIGYLIMEDCDWNCNDGTDGTLYVYRKGDRQFSNMVWKTNVKIKTLFFGKNFFSCDVSENKNILSRANRCSVEMKIGFSSPISFSEKYPTNKIFCEFIYGFLGWTNVSGEMICNGFGNSVLTKDIPIAFCGAQEDHCLRINDVSGSTVGNFEYSGVCGGVGGIDSCLNDTGKSFINGVWSMRFNKTKSVMINKQTDIDSLVLEWMKKGTYFEPFNE